MDGGGRLLRSVTATFGVGIAHEPSYAGAVVPARSGRAQPLASRSGQTRQRIPLRASERVRRRLPRFVGALLLAGFFGAVGGYGVWRGGQYEDFVALHGEPADLV